MKNVRSTLPRQKRPADQMAEFDRLPLPLRRWMAAADLPWSVRSVRRLWNRALQRSGCNSEMALARLEQAQRACIARDATVIWGSDHPMVSVAAKACRQA